MSLRTLVVDDHEAARIGLCELLRGSEISVLTTVGDAEAALEEVNRQQYDVLLIDIQMKKIDGLALLLSIRQLSINVPIVFISAYDYPVYLARAVANGAQDYVLKGDAPETIERTLVHAARYKTALPDGLLDRVQSKMSETIRESDLPDELPLTPREAQVLRHVAYGLSNREIAASLGISVETVKEHVQNILRKTGATDRTDVAVRAVRLGILD